jgi:uncharacterized protein
MRLLYPDDAGARWIPWGALAPVLCVAMVIASQIAGYILLKRFIPLSDKGDPVSAYGLMAFALIPFGFLLALLLGWVRWVERRGLASIGVAGRERVRRFLLGHAVGVASMLLIVASIWLAGGFKLTAPATAWSSAEALLAVALLLPCLALQSSVEELLFRGWLLSVLTRKFNLLAGVALSSALFGLMHYSPGQHLLASISNVLFGVFACCWVIKSRSVIGVMGWHAGWNWMLAVGFGLPLSGLDAGIPSLLATLATTDAHWLNGGAQGPEASIICVGYFVAASAWLYWRSSQRDLVVST